MSIKDLVTTGGKKNNSNNKGLSLPASKNKTDLGRRLESSIAGSAIDNKTMDILKKSQNEQGDIGHLAYIIDATASRSKTWDEATRIQNDMFTTVHDAGDSLSARVVYFGGLEVSDLGWSNNPEDIIGKMSAVSCQMGHTQIYESVQKILNDPKGHKPKNIIMIGDCCEENERVVLQAAHQLRAAGIKVFAFHEDTKTGDDAANGAKIYEMFAKITGGAFESFGSDMKLQDLCTAVATYTSGGDKALKKLASSSKAALAITKQLKLTDARNNNVSLSK